MARFFVKLILVAGALMFVAYLVPGIEVYGWKPALIAAFLLGIANAVVRPILVILTLPITILTLGLFIFIINALLFLWIAEFVDGFEVESLLHALIGSVLVSIVSSFLHSGIKKS